MKPGPLGANHQPHLDTYDCRACGQAWPCALARTYLLATTDQLQLSMRMQAELETAIRVLPQMPPGQMFDRFIFWTRGTAAATSPNTIGTEQADDT